MHGKEKAVGTQKVGKSLNLGVKITGWNTYFLSGTALAAFMNYLVRFSHPSYD